jgi:putative ABC transport system permease protein
MVKAFLLRAWAIFQITIKRLLAQWELAAVTILGLIASISLVICIPLYADAVNHRIFLEKVTGSTSTEPGQLPLVFMFYYYGGWSGGQQWEGIQPFDQFVAKSASTGPILGMPVKSVVRFVRTDYYYLYPPSAQENNYKGINSLLGSASFGFMNGIESHIKLDEGVFPLPAESQSDSVIDVLVSLSLANKLGLQVNENYVVSAKGTTDTGSEVTVLFPVRIAGIWEPIDNSDPYWMFSTANLIDVLLVPEQTFVNRISPLMPDEIYSAIWYLTLDGSHISSNDVGTLLGRISQLEKTASELLPNVKNMRSPEDALIAYHQAVNKLTILLYAFAVPVIGLILAFISLVSNLTIERKRNELAITRSRGATASQVLGSIALESAILGLISFAISIPVAIFLTKMIGQARSFMDFSARSEMRVSLTAIAWQAGLITVIATLVTTLVPAIGAVQHTIVSYKLDRARTVRPPWWQRVWLDVLLLIPVGYGMYMLNKQGGILAIGSSDPLGNPLLFLVPSLAVLACTLIILRLIPLLMGAISWLAARTKMVGLLLATRQLSRSPGHYNTPFLILVFTLSLSAYTASLAQTLDQHLYTKTYYQIGADLRFTEVGESNQSPFPTSDQANIKPAFFFFPVTEYLKLPGIEAVTRVGTYPASATMSSGEGSGVGKFYGIDRIDFPSVAYWRRDFANASLGTLMNAMGATPNGVLVPENMGLAVGDSLPLRVTTDIGDVTLEAKVVGTFKLFPTWYEEDNGPLFVGNLDYLFQEAGGDSPYQVWAKTTPSLDYTQLGNLTLPDLNVRVIGWDAALPNIQQVQQRPEQQGIFGFLFIGFVAAAILTVVGFLLYALFSYQRRFVELGVLRAGGLSRGQMTMYLAFELIFLVVFGGIVGTGLGVWMSAKFIPYLQIGTDVASRVPPFQVVIAWNSIFEIYALFGVLFTLTLVVLVILLERMKIFQAIKLGESV